MNIYVILMLMVFAHVADDYYLQGILANLKQRDWWRKQEGYKALYAYDYLMALAMHSLSWAIMVSLPVVWLAYSWNPPWFFWPLLLAQAAIHGIVDHAKANLRLINLVTDQSIHLFQILTIWAIVVFLGK